MYINIGDAPEDEQQWKYKNMKSPNFSLLFNPQEIQELNYSSQKLYIRFKFTHQYKEGLVMVFLNKVTTHNLVQLLPFNLFESELKGKSINNFFIMQDPQNHKQTFIELLKLRTIKGKSQIFIKECLPGEILENCKVNQTDIANAQFGQNKQRIERVSSVVNEGSITKLKLGFNCIDRR